MSVTRKIRLAAIFTAVAETGGFRAGGRRLGLSPSQVSQGISDLEAELGTALFYRSTRKLQLTEAAETLLPHFRVMMDSFDAGLALLEDGEPNEIRISLPTALATAAVAGVLTEWQTENADTRLVLDVSDGHHVRADTNTDLFIRIGGPADDLRIARLLCEVSGFLAMRQEAFPVAKTAEEVEALPLAIPAGLRSGFAWTHRTTTERVTLGQDATYTVNNTQMLRELLLTGKVVSPVFDFERDALTARHAIVDAAPDWSPGSLPVRAVYASDRPVLSPARSLVDFLGRSLATVLQPPG